MIEKNQKENKKIEVCKSNSKDRYHILYGAYRREFLGIDIFHGGAGGAAALPSILAGYLLGQKNGRFSWLKGIFMILIRATLVSTPLASINLTTFTLRILLYLG